MNLTGSFRLRNNSTIKLSEVEVTQSDSAYGTSTSLSLTNQKKQSDITRHKKTDNHLSVFFMFKIKRLPFQPCISKFVF